MCRSRACIRRKLSVAVASSLVVVSSPAWSQVWGYAEGQLRQQTYEGGTNATSQLATVRVDGSTHLWAPYVARVSGGLGLTYYHTAQDNGDQTGNLVTGEGRLLLFPRSQFPFTAFVERRNSVVSGELAGPDYTYTSYGFKQSFLPLDGTRMSFDYRHADRVEQQLSTQVVPNDSKSDTVSLIIGRAFREHSLDFRADASQITQEQLHQTETRSLAMLRHGYAPGPTLSMQNMASYARDRFENGRPRLTQSNTQVNSATFWRPRTERPTLVTATALFSELATESETQEVKPQFMSVDLGATYQHTPAVTLRGSTGLFEQRGVSTETTVSQTRLGASYAPAGIPLGTLLYRWSVGADVGYRTDTLEGDSRQLGPFFSQSLSRSAPMFGGIGGFSLSQQLAYLDNSAREPESSMTHTATADWSARDAGVTTVTRLMATDSRVQNENDSGFQMINFQATRNHQIDRVSLWSGNATLQWARAPTNPRDSDWKLLGTAGLSYNHLRALNVPRLRFLSEVRYTSEQLRELITVDQPLDRTRETWEWRNRFDYLIGRLEFSLLGTVGEIDGAQNTLFYFQVRRYFGG